MTPVRIQLSRAKGFRLQAHSLALNGLPAVKVDRTTRFGNPYVVGGPVDMKMVRRWGWNFSTEGQHHICATAQEAVSKFAHALLWDEALHNFLRNNLGGKNLGCWCDAPDPCHVIPLLAVANSKSGDIHAIHAAIDKAIHAAAAAVLQRGQQ